MSINETLQEISQRHYKEIKSGATKGQIGEHHLAMAKESCEAVADNFVNEHLDNNVVPTKEEMETVEKRMKDVVKQCRHKVGYTLLASTNQQFEYVVQPFTYKIRKAFEGFRPKNKIGF